MARRDDDKPKLFRYKTGKPGYNLVTVYERYPGGPKWIEFWPHGIRKREPLSKMHGQPVHDEKLAMQIADALAAKIAQGVKRDQARLILGVPEPHTLGELLEVYHARRAAKWEGSSNKRHQEIMRAFWLEKLKPELDVRRLAGMAAEIEQIAAEEADRRGWSPRTEGKYLKYLVTAVNFGQKKLKWYDEKHNLSAVDIPTPDSEAHSYTTAEVEAILARLPAVDLRAAVAGWFAYIGLRRITAIRTLTTDGWRVETAAVGGEIVRLGVQRFPRQTDKARKSRDVILADPGLALAERLLTTPAVRASGLWFPDGSLSDPSRDRKPVSYELLNKWLHEAEVLAGVQVIKGRAWHAFKRAAATDAEEEMGDLAAASEQAGTLKSTLERHYLHRNPKRQAELAVRLARRVGGA